MWKSIKKFFKWIADHTGISWIARKISSGWKWLFGGKANATQQNASQHEERSDNEKQEPAQAQSKDHTTPPAAPDQSQGPVINASETGAKELPENFPIPNLKVGDGGKLLLTLTPEQFAKCKDYKDSQSTSPGGLIMYIKCGENEYRIIGTNNDDLPNTICIKSVLQKNKDGKYIDGNIVLVEGEIERVEKMLGLKDYVTTIKVDSISNRAFEAPTLEQPKPNTTGNNVTQQAVNNDTTIDQPKSPAVPNKSQGNSIVINGIVIQEGAKLKFFPEISDFLSRASLEREISFCKAPNSLFVQTREEQAASNDLSHKSQSL